MAAQRRNGELQYFYDESSAVSALEQGSPVICVQENWVHPSIKKECFQCEGRAVLDGVKCPACNGNGSAAIRWPVKQRCKTADAVRGFYQRHKVT